MSACDAAIRFPGRPIRAKSTRRWSNVLSGFAQSASKFGYDMRLLQHLHEIEEPFEAEQVGSSAMAYKRNPMRAERIDALARHLIVNALNPAFTAADAMVRADARRLRQPPHRHPRGVSGGGCDRADL